MGSALEITDSPTSSAEPVRRSTMIGMASQ
jgi:hypothetical protein